MNKIKNVFLKRIPQNTMSLFDTVHFKQLCTKWLHEFLVYKNVMIYFYVCVCIVGEQQSEFSSSDKSGRGQEAISTRLSVVSRVPFTEEQLFSIFDIVPGLEYCEVQRDPYSNYGKMIVLLLLSLLCFFLLLFLSMTHFYTVYVPRSLYFIFF